MDTDNIKVIEEFEHFDDETKSNVKIPRGLKHILVFGQSRQGKSSIINMMTGKIKKKMQKSQLKLWDVFSALNLG